MLTDAKRKCANALQREVCVEWSLDCAGGFANELDVFEQSLVTRDDRATERCRVTIDVFGGGVDSDVSAEIERTLDRGREERVVDDERDLAWLRDCSNRADVGELECWVRGSFR